MKKKPNLKIQKNTMPNAIFQNLQEKMKKTLHTWSLKFVMKGWSCLAHFDHETSRTILSGFFGNSSSNHPFSAATLLEVWWLAQEWWLSGFGWCGNWGGSWISLVVSSQGTPTPPPRTTNLGLNLGNVVFLIWILWKNCSWPFFFTKVKGSGWLAHKVQRVHLRRLQRQADLSSLLEPKALFQDAQDMTSFRIFQAMHLDLLDVPWFFFSKGSTS